MENWGLVTYRETALLYNPETSSVNDQEWVAKVIAHELSHQWFGNLVTMKWWNDLWLNEGRKCYCCWCAMTRPRCKPDKCPVNASLFKVVR